MRFLLVNQFYPPDMAPTGQVLHAVARCLVARGHEVVVVCSRRSYEGGGGYPPQEWLDGVDVRRVAALGFGRRGPARAADYLSFHLSLLAGVRDPRPFDLALSLTTPPFVGWTVGHSRGLRARRQALWVMDVYPDVLVAHHALAARSLRYRALARLARSQCSRTPLVIALGPRMRDRLRAYAGPSTRLEAVPLWATVDEAEVAAGAVCAVRRSRGWSDGECVLLYSGNMGLGHRLDEFLGAAARLGSRGPIWTFAGGGVRRREVEAFVSARSDARVRLMPYVTQAELGPSLAAADVHLVSLREEWKGLIVPSKLQAAFGIGRPVIFVGPRESEPADWVAESGGGWSIREGDVDGLVRAVGGALQPAERARRGRAARVYAREQFDRERNCARMTELIEEAALNPSVRAS